MKSSVLVIGSTGMLGQALVKELNSRNYKVLGIARTNADVSVDITNNEALQATMDTFKPDVIINTAALVSLRHCEENSSLCYQVNATPSATISKYCAFRGIQYVFISTDHYYMADGEQKHSESSPLVLCNHYSRSKKRGEELSLKDPNALVVRTNIVGFRNYKQNPTFVEWAICALENNSAIRAFNDFYTSSIDVTSFSKYLIELIKRNASGIINLASSQVSSKEQFIATLARRLNFSTNNLIACSMQELDHGIERNGTLGLDVSRAEELLKQTMPNLNDVIESIANEYLGRKCR